MQTITAAAALQLTKTHTVYTKVDVMRQGTVVDSSLGSSTLQVTAGHVDVDGQADIRRRGSLRLLTGLSYGPGAEYAVSYGVGLLDGTTEWIPVGVFSAANRDDTHLMSATGPLRDRTLTLYDRVWRVQRNRWEQPFTVPARRYYSDVIRTLVADRLPWLGLGHIVVPDLPYRTGQLVFDPVNDTPWSAIAQMAASCGHVPFFDGLGWFRMVPDPAVTNPAPVLSISETNGMVWSGDTETNEPGWNGVCVTGTSPTGDTDGVRAVVWDSDPESPTYSDGPYGHVLKFASSPMIVTQQQAIDYARTELARSIDNGFTTKWTMPPNPALDVTDRVTLRRYYGWMLRTVQVDTISLDLGSSDGKPAATMACTGTSR